ncbi:sigma-70 family RNA polymerase sigma factor [Roseateles sp. BYS180W]|uniref:Sigma-70 family RNA polymerase sigma factor n=1 Tax=Roseateles rivi TaxID=3299028 RepID=A0ABW7FTG8_9BURK
MISPLSSDTGLSAGAGQGWREALGRLYREHQPWLQGWLRRKLQQDEPAADLAQDTFVRLLRRATDTEALRAPRAYLSTIAHGLLVNHWQRQDLEAAYLAELAAQGEPQAPSPELRLQQLQQLMALQQLLDGLPPKAARAFLMARLEGMSYADIATELGVSERMVKHYMAQALRQGLQRPLDAAA